MPVALSVAAPCQTRNRPRSSLRSNSPNSLLLCNSPRLLQPINHFAEVQRISTGPRRLKLQHHRGESPAEAPSPKPCTECKSLKFHSLRSPETAAPKLARSTTACRETFFRKIFDPKNRAVENRLIVSHFARAEPESDRAVARTRSHYQVIHDPKRGQDTPARGKSRR